ncbi:MAG: hypothetical protein C0483_01540 [Pirellula sp.]|nr:hypothetical protein [Pirellula sp.]
MIGEQHRSGVALKADAAAPTGFQTPTVPECGLKIAHAPCVEHYAADFDPAERGGIEIWIPLVA